MDFQGYPFTWSNGREGEANIQLRLDHALGTESLLLQFPFYKVLHGARGRSDHSPLIITLDHMRGGSPSFQKFFRFEECWTREDQCEDYIKESWRKGADLTENL